MPVVLAPRPNSQKIFPDGVKCPQEPSGSGQCGNYTAGSIQVPRCSRWLFLEQFPWMVCVKSLASVLEESSTDRETLLMKEQKHGNY